MSRENMTIGFPLRQTSLAGGDWLTARPLSKALSLVGHDVHKRLEGLRLTLEALRHLVVVQLRG